MRLSRGGRGLLEVYHNGAWGTLSAYKHYAIYDFDDRAATVVCRMLGFEKGTALRFAAFGRGIGPIWMDDVHCNGDELSIFDCPSDRFSYHGSHSYDVGVSCEGQIVN